MNHVMSAHVRILQKVSLLPAAKLIATVTLPPLRHSLHFVQHRTAADTNVPRVSHVYKPPQVREREYGQYTTYSAPSLSRRGRFGFSSTARRSNNYDWRASNYRQKDHSERQYKDRTCCNGFDSIPQFIPPDLLQLCCLIRQWCTHGLV